MALKVGLVTGNRKKVLKTPRSFEKKIKITLINKI